MSLLTLPLPASFLLLAIHEATLLTSVSSTLALLTLPALLTELGLLPGAALLASLLSSTLLALVTLLTTLLSMALLVCHV